MHIAEWSEMRDTIILPIPSFISIVFSWYVRKNRGRTNYIHTTEPKEIAYRKIHSFKRWNHEWPQHWGDWKTGDFIPWHMHKYSQDAMTYVRKHGRPDLFITFTCNSSWLEIKENIIYRQAPMDCYDIIARFFFWQ